VLIVIGLPLKPFGWFAYFSWGRTREYLTTHTMPLTTDTDLKELRDLIIGLREKVRVGFDQVDIKFAQAGTGRHQDI
jgi:hypothetical protein